MPKKTMTNPPDKDKAPSFWIGFALGSLTLTAAAYMVGTKKGREKLKQLLEYADTMHDMPEEMFAMLPAIREMLKKDPNQLKAEELDKTNSMTEHITSSLEAIIEKVKTNSEEKKDTSKKYFIKDEA